MTAGPGIEPGPHWWKASALTTAPSLLPYSRRKVDLPVVREILIQTGSTLIRRNTLSCFMLQPETGISSVTCGPHLLVSDVTLLIFCTVQNVDNPAKPGNCSISGPGCSNEDLILISG